METKPTLALIPSAYKASKVYSVLPADGVGDFDFSRSGQATRVNKDGLIETVGGNTPRLNYPMIDGVVSGCPSLLLEPESTNLITHSEDFSDASWDKVDAIMTPNVIISPSGNLDADKFIANNSLDVHTIFKSVANNDYTFSIFLKKGEETIVSLWLSNVSKRAIFDLENGTIIDSTVTSAKMENYGNGWYRCQAYDTDLTTDVRLYGRTGNAYQGNSSDGFYIWGAQVEEGSYATSYIPTNGSAVTRSAETCTGSGDANTFNDSEGVLMVEVSALDNLGSFENLSLSNGFNTSRVTLFYRNSLNLMEFRVTVNNSIQMQFQYVIEDAKTFNKMLIKYKQNDFAVWINGFELHTDSNGITFGSYPLNYLGFNNGEALNPASPFYGNTKQLQYFDKALTDTDLEELTSWKSFNEMAKAQLYTIQ